MLKITKVDAEQVLFEISPKHFKSELRANTAECPTYKVFAVLGFFFATPFQKLSSKKAQNLYR
ncbi:hypothetical protein ACLVXC_001175 [Vibrio alginolyticus]|uniref:hypothetical protein n=1 Tax=unclassified Vibrio TaxID=2614977 RepID=UPI001E347F4D|nr:MULTISPECIES: hypothetical protein [unclassified Vibrio]MCC9650630.1 hypothetical protein [Vibrio sp. MA64]